MKLLELLRKEDIEKIVIENDDLHASAVQLLWSVSKEKKIKVKSDFLKPFFENIKIREAA